MKKMVLGMLSAFLLWGCGGTRSNDPDAINDALIGFTMNAQASRWPEALAYVTEDEVDEISDGQIMKPEYQLAAKRLKLSTLKQMEWEVDGHGRLVGIKDAMDESNERYKVSEAQKTVGTDLEQKRQQRIQKKLEEGKRLMAEEKKEDNTPEVEYYTNKLTEAEKRKYGSTGELRPPEEGVDAPDSLGSADSVETDENAPDSTDMDAPMESEESGDDAAEE